MALEAMREGMVVIGLVERVLPSSLQVAVRRVCTTQELPHQALSSDHTETGAAPAADRWVADLEQLGLRARVHSREVLDFELKNAADLVKLMEEQYPAGQMVRAAVKSVDVTNQVINLSFRTAQAELAVVGGQHYGAIDLDPFDSGQANGASEQQSQRAKHDAVAKPVEGGYPSALEANQVFRNPACLDAMIAALGVSEHLGLFGESGVKGRFYDDLRLEQNKVAELHCETEWLAGLGPSECEARNRVQQGAPRHKWAGWTQPVQDGMYEKALASYEQALEIDPGNANAHVAKGAAYANKNLLESAISEFDLALKSDPDHENAQKYREITQSKLTTRYKEQQEAKAKETAERERAARKAQERKDKDPKIDDKLKALLKAERKKGKKEKEKKHKKDKHKKKKKKKRKRSKSSSTSDSE